MNTKALTLRMPTEMHEALRMKAFDERTSVTALILGSLESNVEKPGTLCDARACWKTPERIVSGGFHFCGEHGPVTGRKES